MKGDTMKLHSLLRIKRGIMHLILFALFLGVTVLGAVVISGFVLKVPSSPSTNQAIDGRLASQVKPSPAVAPLVKPSPGNSAAASIVYIDPKTRVATTPPPDVKAELQAALAADPAFSTSSDGLKEEPSPVPGGGMMINLQGRFQSAATAATDSHGRIVLRH
jgi:hypothetical protein